MHLAPGASDLSGAIGTMSMRMPAVFYGHGNPMNALERNPYTEAWGKLGAKLPRPRAVVSLSAHCYIQDAAVTVSTATKTIHDFGARRLPRGGG